MSSKSVLASKSTFLMNKPQRPSTTLRGENLFCVANHDLLSTPYLITYVDEITGIREGRESTADEEVNLSNVEKLALEHASGSIRDWVLFKHPFAGVSPRTALLHTVWHQAVQELAPHVLERDPGKA